MSTAISFSGNKGERNGLVVPGSNQAHCFSSELEQRKNKIGIRKIASSYFEEVLQRLGRV